MCSGVDRKSHKNLETEVAEWADAQHGTEELAPEQGGVSVVWESFGNLKNIYMTYEKQQSPAIIVCQGKLLQAHLNRKHTFHISRMVICKPVSILVVLKILIMNVSLQYSLLKAVKQAIQREFTPVISL